MSIWGRGGGGGRFAPTLTHLRVHTCLCVYNKPSLLVIMHNSGTIISKTGVRYKVNGQMVVDEAVDHLWEPEKN